MTPKPQGRQPENLSHHIGRDLLAFAVARRLLNFDNLSVIDETVIEPGLQHSLNPNDVNVDAGLR